MFFEFFIKTFNLLFFIKTNFTSVNNSVARIIRHHAQLTAPRVHEYRTCRNRSRNVRKCFSSDFILFSPDVWAREGWPGVTSPLFIRVQPPCWAADMRCASFSVLLFLLSLSETSAASHVVSVDVQRAAGELRHFWRSTGFWWVRYELGLFSTHPEVKQKHWRHQTTSLFV